MKNKFLQISFGVSMMMLSAGFLIRSVSTAEAAPTPEKFVAEGTNKLGKYMMTMSTDDGHPTVIIWDTETGKNKYYENYDTWRESGDQLPAIPLGE
jgi:hypothetical protein